MKSSFNCIKIMAIAALALPVLLITTAAFGQTTGNPLRLEKGAWSIGVGMDFTEYEIENHEYTMSKALAKIDFALGAYADLALLLGANNLHVTYPAARRLTRFKSPYQFAGGGVLKLTGANPWEKNNNLFVEGGGLTYDAIGTVFSTAEDTEGEAYYMKFKVQEYWGTAGTIFLFQKFDFYVAYQGRVVHHREQFSHTDFKSGLKSSGIIGIDVKFPERYVLNLQFRYFNGVTFSIGLSQAAFWNN